MRIPQCLVLYNTGYALRARLHGYRLRNVYPMLHPMQMRSSVMIQVVVQCRHEDKDRYICDLFRGLSLSYTIPYPDATTSTISPAQFHHLASGRAQGLFGGALLSNATRTFPVLILGGRFRR